MYVTGKESNSIVVFRVDRSDGGLTVVGESAMNSSTALDGPTALAASPDGRCLFVAAVGNGSRTSLSIGDSNGVGAGTVLTYAGSVSDAALVDVGDVLVSPASGRHVYVSSPACGCIMTFAADLETCGLTYLSDVAGPLVAPAGMAVSPDGLILYATDSAAASGGGALVLFSRDPETGELTQLQTVADGEGLFA